MIIVSQGIQYLATVTERGGKVYAFFVKSPTKVSHNFYRVLIQSLANVTACQTFAFKIHL